MKKINRLASWALTCLLAFSNLCAAEFPTVSTEGNEVWYLIRFMNGGNALTAANEGAEITTASTTAADDQLWKLEGNATDGYVFTNKKGYTLFVAQAEKNEKVKAASSPSGVSKFTVSTTQNAAYAGGFEIHPVGNASVSMNLWGGPSENRGVGLWDAADMNNPVRFTSLTEYNAVGGLSLVPYPQNLTITAEGNFDFGTITTITYPSAEVKKHAENFAVFWTAVSGLPMEVVEGSAEGIALRLLADENQPAEGYQLNVTQSGVDIKASAPAGFFYALQTLKQLLPREVFEPTLQEKVVWTVPFVDITDQPTLGHRGFMMDIARHFFNKEEVKRVLDIMALYKMNRFHWHLTDDQGWRIEIPEYPLLTEVGAVRSGSFTSPGEGTKFFDDTEYGRGMYYTLDELKEIVAYAQERHIEILPEVDMPGHMVAAVTAYPAFSCDSTKEYSVRIDGGISEDVLNVGDDKVIDFLKCVLDHLADVFPYPYVHIGGDECPTKQWENNPDCLRRVKEEGLSGVNELQSWLVEELGTYVKEKHGKDIVVWDELLNHWNSDNSVKPVIMAWNNINKSRDAAAKGFKSIIVPYQALYLDFMQVEANRTNVDEPYYGGWGDNWVNTIETVYALNPLGALSGKEEFCMGVQGNLWAETLNDFGELQYQLLPRMLALSEIGWLENGKKSWDSFYRRLQNQDEILDALGYTYARHYIEPDELTDNEALLQEVEDVLRNTQAGKAGYPSKDVCDQLQAIYDVALLTPENETILTALKEKLDAYKTAPIVQPMPKAYYQIVSASTYYRKQFNGSTLYQSGSGARFHYTPQTEPEELWYFERKEGSETPLFYLRNVCTDEFLSMPQYNQAVSMTKGASTVLRVDKATIPTEPYHYIPGTVVISAYDGYSQEITGSVKRLSAQTTGQIFAKDDAALCYSGTWRLVEIENFNEQLQGLVDKCEAILRSARPGNIGEPTQDALNFLNEKVKHAAEVELSRGEPIIMEVYINYLNLYKQFCAMPRTSVLDGISEAHYYMIQNAHFTDYYAAAYTNIVQPKKQDKNRDGQYWRFVKNEDGTVAIINKQSEKAAFTTRSAEGAIIYANYSGSGLSAWTLQELTTDQGKKGIAIVEPSGVYSWYTNPDAFGNIILKPKDWGASIWKLIQADAIPTSIQEVKAAGESSRLYDLSGRRVKSPQSGIYIKENGEKYLVR